MKIFLQFMFSFLLVFNLTSVVAQVSFTNHGSLLGSISGSSVEDCVVDMNGDFLDDVVRVQQSNLYIDYQQADGSFTQSVFNMNFNNLPSWSICAGDINADGFNDLLFGSGNRVSFVYARENGTAYEEVNTTPYIFSQRTTFADIDNDGNLDAFICHDVDQSHPYRNDGNGNLVLDQTLIETLDMPGNYAAIWVDYDNDWDSDLYVTKCKLGSTSGDADRTNRLYRNNGDGTYTEVAEEANLADNAQSWATVFEDFDNDGDFDAFIVNHDFQNRFYINDGTGHFTDTINYTGIPPTDLGAWQNASGDFNNDGFIDIFSQLNNELYLNNGDMTFTGQNLSFSSGGIGDLNNDGFLDIVSGNSMRLNDGNDNNWVKINTLGIFSNRNGIGARVEIFGDWGIQIREVRSGQSFSPMSSLCAHFGLGQAEAIDSIVVKWPSGTRSVLMNPEVNNTYNISEAECSITETIELSYEGALEICAGDSLLIEAPEGFTYQWSNGDSTQSITVTEAGNYSLIATDSVGCIGSSEVVGVAALIDIPPTITAYGGATSFCVGDTVTLGSSEESNYTWSTGETTQEITVTESGEYFVSTEAICQEEALSSSSIIVEVVSTVDPVVEEITREDDGTYTLEATGDSLYWYASEIGDDLIGNGDVFTTDILTADTILYVENRVTIESPLQAGGKLDFDGGGGLPGTGAYSYFDAFVPFIIEEVTVFVPNNASEGTRTIQLVDNNDQVLDTKLFNLSYGVDTLELGFLVPQGVDFSLRCPENDLFRSNGNLQYPYPLGEMGEITTSFYGDGYYYYFYNWQVRLPDEECISERIPVPIIVIDVEELSTLSEVKVFPNPANEQLFIDFNASESGTLFIQMQDATGRTVMNLQQESMIIGNNRLTLDTQSLPAGFYQLTLRIGDQLGSIKVIIE